MARYQAAIGLRNAPFSRAAAERLAANAWNSRQMPQRIRRRNEKTRGDINKSAEI
jgi:hypothetical protein